MIELVFKGTSGFHTKTVGPAHSIRIAGNFVRDAQSGEILARYEEFHWAVEDQFFTSYQCSGPAVVYFEEFLGGRTAAAGPFQFIHTADGVMYCDDTLFARFLEESLLWHAVQSSTRWPILVIESAGV